ncbi:MAG: hypothetical protein PS018_00605 [bacterium]|nr:hypothetical protein [bacterium]
MTKITNIATSQRGFWHKGIIVSVAPGETVEHPLTSEELAGVKGNPESFAVGAAGEKAAEKTKADDLASQASELGIKIDKRWGDERIQAEIDKKLAE